ncbi:MAG TPA: MBL fold metallo-hydrolase [Sedimentisphaerales bacterium]|nr:MBL fold metallo-hydrolase [Sedimentisphaerales bacterium]
MIKAIYLSLLMPALLAAADRGPAEYVRIERLSERVLLAYWLGTGRCNLTAIQSEKGLAIIDTEMSPRIMMPIKNRIEKVFGRNDWVYVINTHAHMHHTGGNNLFKGATVIGHDNLPEDMQWLVDKQTDPERKRKDLDYTAQTIRNLRAVLPRVEGNRADTRRIRGEIKFWQLYAQDIKEGYEVVKPSLTFADRHKLDLGDLKLELVFFGKGHSLSDILIYVPQEKLLVTGAIVYQRAHLPEIGEQSELQDVNRFLAVLDSFLAEGVQIDRVVPSHSTPLLQSDLVPVRDYYWKMLTGVRAVRQEGLILSQVTEIFALRTKFPGFRVPQAGQWDYGMHERNIRNLWRILNEQEQPPLAEQEKH